MFPERSVLIGQKWVENAKIENFKCDNLSNFQPMCVIHIVLKSLEEAYQITMNESDEIRRMLSIYYTKTEKDLITC